MGALHASEMYARNVYNFLALMLGKDGELKLDWDDELVAKTCLVREGQLAA
jgi:NAD(P) transhydrogenase subunit alpha